MKRSANYGSHLTCEEYELKNNTETLEYVEVTPLYEKKLYDKRLVEHYSFVNNEKLHCLWRKKVDSIGLKREVKIKRLNQIPDFARDYHFHNQDSKLMPSQSLRNRPRAHFVLTPSQGIDKDVLIPDDMLMKRNQRDNNPDKYTAIGNRTALPKKGVKERLISANLE